MTFDDGAGDDGGGGRRKPQKPRKPHEYTPREPRPLDAAQFQELALGYAARYATTAAKLRRYLARKLQERQWTPSDPPDIEALVARITGLGYVDDRAYATLKARELGARGFGQRRVRATLSAAGVSRDDSAAVLDPDDEAAPAPPACRGCGAGMPGPSGRRVQGWLKRSRSLRTAGGSFCPLPASCSRRGFPVARSSG